MSKNQRKKIFVSDKPDKLFSEFIREMDDHSTNGIVKKLDPLHIEPLVDHFLAQCDNFEDKLELHERIQILLSAKFKYALAEGHLVLSTELEKSIHEKIKDVFRTHFDSAAKFAGFILNWAVVKPVKFIKTAVEPVVANSVLTYSIAIHPPYLDTAQIEGLNTIKPAHEKTVEIVQTEENATALLKDLEIVKKYSDDDLANLTQNTINPNGTAEVKKAVTTTKAKTSSAAVNTNMSRENSNSQSVYVDVERRLTLHTPVMANIEPNVRNVKRYAGELRPIGDVQRIIAQNDHRIYNCFNSYKKTGAKKNGRISMKFQISSKGVVKNVKVTYNSFNQTLADRVTLQMKFVRFAEIDTKLGDQTVYHTFYF